MLWTVVWEKTLKSLDSREINQCSSRKSTWIFIGLLLLKLKAPIFTYTWWEGKNKRPNAEKDEGSRRRGWRRWLDDIQGLIEHEVWVSSRYRRTGSLSCCIMGCKCNDYEQICKYLHFFTVRSLDLVLSERQSQKSSGLGAWQCGTQGKGMSSLNFWRIHRQYRASLSWKVSHPALLAGQFMKPAPTVSSILMTRVTIGLAGFYLLVQLPAGISMPLQVWLLGTPSSSSKPQEWSLWSLTPRSLPGSHHCCHCLRAPSLGFPEGSEVRLSLLLSLSPSSL